MDETQIVEDHTSETKTRSKSLFRFGLRSLLLLTVFSAKAWMYVAPWWKAPPAGTPSWFGLTSNQRHVGGGPARSVSVGGVPLVQWRQSAAQ